MKTRQLVQPVQEHLNKLKAISNDQVMVIIPELASRVPLTRFLHRNSAK